MLNFALTKNKPIWGNLLLVLFHNVRHVAIVGSDESNQSFQVSEGKNLQRNKDLRPNAPTAAQAQKMRANRMQTS
jgi:hypothetical protein